MRRFTPSPTLSPAPPRLCVCRPQAQLQRHDLITHASEDFVAMTSVGELLRVLGLEEGTTMALHVKVSGSGW